jgi:hypothetical protein
MPGNISNITDICLAIYPITIELVGVDGVAKVAPRRIPLRGEAPREPGVYERLVECAPVRQLATTKLFM